jgi:hypothetical protein
LPRPLQPIALGEPNLPLDQQPGLLLHAAVMEAGQITQPILGLDLGGGGFAQGAAAAVELAEGDGSSLISVAFLAALG